MSVSEKKSSLSSLSSSFAPIERLEGRQLFSAVPAANVCPPGEPVQAEFHFVARANSTSPSLQIDLENVLVSNYGMSGSASAANTASPDTTPTNPSGAGVVGVAGKVKFQDISFTTKMNKSSPK